MGVILPDGGLWQCGRMEFRDVVRRRRMVRAYHPDRPVPPEILDEVLRHATHAPSAGFSQGWAFLVLDRPEDLARFWDATTPAGLATSPWLKGLQTAPAIIVPLSSKSAYLERYAEPDKGWTDKDETRWPVPYWHIDTGMASLLMLLTAVDRGLGACFFGIPPQQTAAFRTAFDVPDEYTPIGAVSLGYRATDRKSPSLKRGRREVPEVVHRGRW
jgi:nitroreductase